MVPIANHRGIVAMIELGRSDREFRIADGAVLRAVASTVGAALTPHRTFRRELDRVAARLDASRFGFCWAGRRN